MSFASDSRGNITSGVAGSFGYDAENNLTSAGGANYLYDPLGRLTVEGNATPRRFLYDGFQIVGEYPSGGGTIVNRYVPGAGLDDIAAYYTGSGTGTRHFPLADERLSVIGIADGSGTASVNAYDEYGTPAPGNTGRFQYTGQMWLADAGLQYSRMRTYAPGLGRFVQADPIGYAAGANLYAYVRADPINLIDPLGLYYVCRVGLERGTYINSGTIGRFTWREGEIAYERNLYGICGGPGSSDPTEFMGVNFSDLSRAVCSAVNSSYGREVVRLVNRAARYAPSGWYYAQLQSHVIAGIGGGVSAGFAVEVRDGRVVDSFVFTSNIFGVGLNVDVGGGVYYSNINLIGRSLTVNIDVNIVSVSLVVPDGLFESWGFAFGAENLGPTAGGFTVEDVTSRKIKC